MNSKRQSSPIHLVLFRDVSSCKLRFEVCGVVVGIRFWSQPTGLSALTIFVYAENIHRMTYLSNITGFDWDEGTSRKSHDKHDVSPAEAEQVFFNELLLLFGGEKHSEIEARYHAYGKSDKGRKLHIVFTLRKDGQHIRVISARNMHRKERMTYEKA